MGTFETAADTFLKQAVNLGDADMPLTVALREVAKTLDSGGVNASLVNQYRLAYQTLYERAVAEGVEVDPLEALLAN